MSSIVANRADFLIKIQGKELYDIILIVAPSPENKGVIYFSPMKGLPSNGAALAVAASESSKTAPR